MGLINMKDFVKTFNTPLYKSVLIIENDKTGYYDVRVSFYKSDAITLLREVLKKFRSIIYPMRNLYQYYFFFAEIYTRTIRFVVKGKFQIRTIVNNLDIIEKYVFERLGVKI